MPDLAARLKLVQSRIAAACTAAGRPPGSARLLAVSKTVDVQTLAAAQQLGVGEFGESYLQEALPKIAALQPPPVWHFIGPIQSNKTRDIAAHFEWVHGVDRLKIAQRLSDQRPPELPPLSVCVQVNISNEASKAGCSPEQTLALCLAIAGLPRLRLRGLMAIPAPLADDADAAAARAPYAALRELAEQVKSRLEPRAAGDFDTISAGMSDDLEAAIAEGSSLVRIGSALFGSRT
ncbi:YggS family pyridoxal phosphate-dependent enzyme [Hydrocarboniphaga sp.]|uniref:YggS family pyridoxal phosphate-dependent enzyme n=1 Tax=Hydrocarboniphaga sp. TaxID=2033016 RepID=UPI003D148F42